MRMQILTKINPFIKGLFFAVLPLSVSFVFYPLIGADALLSMGLLLLFSGVGYGVYYYSRKTKNKGIEKVGFIALALITYILSSFLYFFIFYTIIYQLKNNVYTAEINSLISNPEKNNKEELLNFKKNTSLLSEENEEKLDKEILRIEEEEAKKAEQAEIERKKQEEAKKLEAEKVAKAKRIEEGYMDFSGTAKEVAIDGLGKDEYDSYYIGPVQPFTSVKAPDGTLTVQLTMNMEGRFNIDGDLIRTITFPPNELKSSIYEMKFPDSPERNDRSEPYGFGANKYEIINSTTIWNQWNNTHIKFSTPFTKP